MQERGQPLQEEGSPEFSHKVSVKELRLPTSKTEFVQMRPVRAATAAASLEEAPSLC